MTSALAPGLDYLLAPASLALDVNPAQPAERTALLEALVLGTVARWAQPVDEEPQRRPVAQVMSVGLRRPAQLAGQPDHLAVTQRRGHRAPGLPAELNFFRAHRASVRSARSVMSEVT